jgi:hypothetical protein
MAVFTLSAVSINAQQGIRVNVPFDFTVGDQTLAAGLITARGVSAADAGPLSIRNYDKGQHAFRIARKAQGADTSEQAKLVFHRYGDRYFLAEVWIPGTNAWTVLKSKSEKTLMREMRISNNIKQEVVSIFAD